MQSKLVRSIVLVSFILTGCRLEMRTDITATATTSIITATLPPTLSPPPAETPFPPPPSPTVTPVRGTTSTQLNVRAEPSTTSNVLGVIPANTEVQIVGTDPGGNWWQILYQSGAEGKGWVTAQYVQTASKPEVPVIGGGETDPNAANSAVVIQKLNIRSGPGTSFNSLGILNVNDVVNLTGKNRDGTWLQIEFAAGPEGKGWVNSGFVKTDHANVLPIVADSGEVVGTGTPMDTPLPPTPTIVPASIDSDSADNPLVSVMFERTGTNSLIYTGDVSSPIGDTEDWIAFTPYGNVVYARLQCIGSSAIRVEIQGTDITLLCDQPAAAVIVTPGLKTLIHIHADSSSEQLQYTQYILTVKATP